MTERHYSILLVDDDMGILDGLYDALAEKYAVYKVKNPAEALAVLEETNVDLILSNQPMPASVCTDFFAEAKGTSFRSNRVLLTGISDLQRAVDIIRARDINTCGTGPWDAQQVFPVVLEVFNARLRQATGEKERLEMQFIQNAKMASLGELVTGIAHELNNPLSFIHANLGNLNRFYNKMTALLDSYDATDLPPNVREAIDGKKNEIKYDYIKSRMSEMIERSSVGADRMKQIIQDLKAFSRMDAEQIQEADINANIETTLGILSHESKNRIEIKKDFGNLPPVACHIGKLNQVFLNLLINACHAIEDKGEIRIKTELEGGSVKIQISDTGKGIPKDISHKIFDPFFTTKPIGQGTGLGLSISHEIIKQHQGEILVQSDPWGTTFTIRIPMKRL